MVTAGWAGEGGRGKRWRWWWWLLLVTDGERTRCGITNRDRSRMKSPSAQDISMTSSVGQLWRKTGSRDAFISQLFFVTWEIKDMHISNTAENENKCKRGSNSGQHQNPKCLCKVCLYSLCRRSQAHHFLHHLLLSKLTHSWDSICTQRERERVNARQLFSQLPAKWGNGSGGIPTLLRVVNPLSSPLFSSLPASLLPFLPPPNVASAVNKPASVVLGPCACRPCCAECSPATACLSVPLGTLPSPS